MSIDPDLAETGQPYAFTGDDSLNSTDPLGLSGGVMSAAGKKSCDRHPKQRRCKAYNMVKSDSIGGKNYEANKFNHGFWAKASTVMSYSPLALPLLAAAPEALAASGLGEAAGELAASCDSVCTSIVKFVTAETAATATQKAISYEAARDQDPNTLPLFQVSSDLLNVLDGMDFVDIPGEVH